MPSNEPPYDPYIPSGGNAAGSSNGQNNGQINALKGQIDDTLAEMRKNVDRLQEREENINSLGVKSENLAASAQGFRRGANRVRKQMWWKDMKMRICIIVGIIILLLVIIVPIVVKTR
ncbi:MAG: hypothetical protein GOMPHAMPRED_004765 [Gomphillus americanus]|uniref:V-SNARE coiled-coil homology domain-containing protein n=1 Tax=Gomphillus americanus TaxID=1940652 RepID=A0A8H3EIS2_9LECA|nr:MAG: hypothetical protein GOMPHAMPRED_004765 [Gomphillus americanus]